MTPHLDGSTQLAGLIGWPLTHTLSPAMHNAAYEAMGLNWVYMPLAVRDGATLTRAIAGIRAFPFVGFNVTMPYKRLVLNMCDEVATQAQLAGSVNTVHLRDGKMIGYNTDGRGLLEALTSDAGFDPAGREIVILGAGGGAAAALVALALGHAKRIAVLNRSEDRANALIERVRERLRGVELIALPLDPRAEDRVRAADLVLNATPVGMSVEDPSPIPVTWLRSGQVVADMVYGAQPTSLVRAARDAGAVALDGLGMLVCQGAMSIDIWHGEADMRAPRDVMRAAALAALGEGV